METGIHSYVCQVIVDTFGHSCLSGVGRLIAVYQGLADTSGHSYVCQGIMDGYKIT